MEYFSMRAGRAALLSGIALTTVLATPAFAADAMDEDGTIVVNARHREAYTPQSTSTGAKTDVPLRDIPAAVVVIPSAVLEDQAAQTLDEALINASAVAPSYGGGYGLADNYVIRGLAVRFLRDGLPDGPSFMGYRRSLADVASIEVLKGPGSALYGRAEAGGSINISTRQPLDTFAVEGIASYGSYDNLELTGDVGGALTEGVNTRLIGNYERTDGYRGLSRRMTEILPTVAFRLSDNHTLTVDYDYRDSSLVVDNFGIPFTTNRRLANVRADSRIYSPFNRVDQTIHRVTVKDEYEATDTLKLRAAVIYDKRDIDVARDGGASVLNTTTNQITGRSGRTQVDDAEYWTAQGEVIATPTTGAIEHTILAGVEYSHTDVSTVRYNYTLLPITFTNGVPNTPNTTIPAKTLSFDRRILSSSLSVYGQEQMNIADVFKIRAGFRYDNVKLDDNPKGSITPATRRGTSDLFSWQVGAVYQPTDWVSLYGGYSKGQFITIQTESASLLPIPEDSSQFEAGVKANLLNGKLSVNLAAFETKRDKYFLALAPGADPVQQGKQRSRGIEADIIGAPLPGLTLIANFAYVEAISRASATASVAGITATPQPIYGKQLGSTPKTSGSFWANYALTQGPLAGLGFGAGLTYKDSVYVDTLELLKVPSYVVYRAAVTYRTEHYEAQVTVNNITDKTYYTTPTFIGALPGDPRTVKVTLRTRF